MSATFCIKKNPTSVLNPWLCKMSLEKTGLSGVVYASPEDIVKGHCILFTFSTVEEAETFIASNPECDERCLVCEMKGQLGQEPEMVPV